MFSGTSSGYSSISSPPDCTPPGTPRGNYQFPRDFKRGAKSPSISSNLPSSPKGTISDDHVEDLSRMVGRLDFNDDLLYGKGIVSQGDMITEPKYQTLEPEHSVNTNLESIESNVDGPQCSEDCKGHARKKSNKIQNVK